MKTRHRITVELTDRELAAVRRELAYHNDDPGSDKRGLELWRNDQALCMSVLRQIAGEETERGGGGRGELQHVRD